MIITISGMPGTGKTSLANALAKHFKLKRHSIGEFMREMAKKRGMSLHELTKIAENDKTIDHELDKWQIEIGKTDDDFVIDGRLSWHFIPKSIKILLLCDLHEAAKRRVHEQKGNEESKETVEHTMKLMKSREDSEHKRYKQYYGLDYADKKHYDIVFDTSHKKIEETAEEVIKLIS